MRVLLITNHFYPEEFRCNDLAFELCRRGHRVTVLTAIPDYPQGKFHKGYGVFRKRAEHVQGVKVLHSFIVPRGDGQKLRLMMNYVSSLMAQCWDALWMGLFGRYDYVLVHETSPVMVGIPGVIISKMRHVPMDFWVLDLWPESLQDAGGMNNAKVLGVFGKMTTWIYKHSRKILISSRGFKNSICEKGDFEDKLVYFPNWADVALLTDDVKLPEDVVMPDGFKVMFAGNIGEAQDMDSLMAAALELKEEKDIHFCIVGDGRKRPWVESFVEKHDLESTVHLLGRHPIESMPAFFQAADVMLVTLKDSKIFNRTAPAKIQAYMNAAKPIAAMMNGEGAAVVADAGCGYSVNAGDSKGLAELIFKMKNMGIVELEAMGMKGKQYCDENFSFAKAIEKIENLMEIAGKSQRAPLRQARCG